MRKIKKLVENSPEEVIPSENVFEKTAMPVVFTGEDLKQILEPATLGEYLLMRRMARRRGIKDIAREVKIPVHYIEALEKGNYKIFSAKIYARGFLKKMCMALGCSVFELEEILHVFEKEWDASAPQSVLSHTRMRQNSPITLGRILAGCGIAGCIIFFIFSVFQVRRFIGAPRLVVEKPAPYTIVEQPTVIIKGQTEKEGRLTVNGREITIGEQGFFNEEIELRAGVNKLEFITQNKQGNVTKEERYVVVR